MKENNEIINENKKNNSLLLIIALATLLVAIIGASFAFFTATISGNGVSTAQVTTSTTDSLVYTPGSPISLTATQQNFYLNAGNQSGSTTSTVQLLANNTETATYCYTVDVNITTNEFIYTVNSSTPELTLSVTKSAAGAEATSVLSNYDITTKTGSVNIPTTLDGTVFKNSITATASASTTDSFIATVTMVNLGTKQTANEGKNFSAKLVLTTVSCS
jgi:hypothetical protein